MPVKDLLARIEELRDVMTLCQEKMSSLVKDYQVNVLQTAAVIAAAKITEEKAVIEKKRLRLRRQIEKERERSQETVKNVCSSAGKTIEALIRDQEKELREAVKCAEQQQEVEIAETQAKTDQKITDRKRKHSALQEECDDYDEDFECADCGRRSPNMFMCDQCHATTYCNELCQERDWDNHQKHCTAEVD